MENDRSDITAIKIGVKIKELASAVTPKTSVITAVTVAEALSRSAVATEDLSQVTIPPTRLILLSVVLTA